jgi:ABC-2 type transport system permease protein
MILYFFMISMVGYTADPKTAFAMEEDIASGTITPYLTRPISYIAGLVMSTISQNIFFMLLPGMVIIVPLIFLFHVSVTLQLVSVLAAELVACYLISLLIGILMGTCAVYLTRISGMINSEQFLATILGGSIVPISLFPAKISSILSLLPFQFLYYVPAATFSGELPIGAAIGSLWLAAVWIVILSIAAYAFWTRARKRITAVGV